MQQIQVTSLSSKGQIVIPNDMRQFLKISIGTKFLIFSDGDNLLLKPIQIPKFEAFKTLIKESKKIAAGKNIKKNDVQKFIKNVLNESRS